MNYTLEVELANMPEGWVLFGIGKEQPVIAPPPVRERIIKVLERADYLEKKVDYYKEQKEILEDQRAALENEVAARDAQIYALEQQLDTAQGLIGQPI